MDKILSAKLVSATDQKVEVLAVSILSDGDTHAYGMHLLFGVPKVYPVLPDGWREEVKPDDYYLAFSPDGACWLVGDANFHKAARVGEKNMRLVGEQVPRIPQARPFLVGDEYFDKA